MARNGGSRIFSLSVTQYDIICLTGAKKENSTPHYVYEEKNEFDRNSTIPIIRAHREK